MSDEKYVNGVRISKRIPKPGDDDYRGEPSKPMEIDTAAYDKMYPGHTVKWGATLEERKKQAAYLDVYGKAAKLKEMAKQKGEESKKTGSITSDILSAPSPTTTKKKGT